MEFIPYKANECFEHLYYQIPMELFFNKSYKDKLNSYSKHRPQGFETPPEAGVIFQKFLYHFV